MKTIMYLIKIFLIILYFPMAFAASPEGFWTAIDDKTGKKRAVVDLSIHEGELSGKIVKIYRQPGDLGICAKCPGHFKDKPTMGLRILWGLKHKQDGLWTDGNILDAKTGKIYRVRLTVKGDKMYVRGYIGIAMMGRTQVWIRNKQMS